VRGRILDEPVVELHVARLGRRRTGPALGRGGPAEWRDVVGELVGGAVPVLLRGFIGCAQALGRCLLQALHRGFEIVIETVEGV